MRPSSLRTRQTRVFRRGFTLVELLVAVTAGVAVAAAAVLLSKNAVRLFQEEARMSYAQVALAMGLNRLGVDLEQAGRNMTKNPYKDTRVCAQGNFIDWPVGMRNLAPIIIEKQPDLAQNVGNDLRSERITIAGDLETGENFVMNAPLPGANGTTIVLQPQSRAIRRLTAMVANGSIITRLNDIFRVGRVLHIEGPTSDYYGVIQGFNASGTPLDNVTVQLQPLPVVPMQPLSALPCAVKGFGAGWPVHVLERVRYDIRSLVGNNNFTDYMQPANPVAGDDIRTELVRVELGLDDTEIANTMEIVAEYAVSLRFGVTALALGSTKDAPILERFPIQDPQPNAGVYTVAGAPNLGNTRPEAVRNVHVRLATRSRWPDRPTPIAGPAGRPYRFFVSTAKTAEKYARVRTVEREFALINMKGGTP